MENHNLRLKSLITNVILLLPILLILLIYNSEAQVSINSNNYTTLQAALAAINTGTYTGAITVSITGNTTETGVAQLNSGSIAPANYTSVTIKPTAAYTITAAHGGVILYINGASNVTIDGSKSIGGTTQDLTFLNNASTSTISVANAILSGTTYGGDIYASSGSNIIIKNTVMYTNGLLTSYAVLLNSITNGTVNNCLVKRALMGILVQLSSNIIITNNIVGSTTSTDQIGWRGITFYGVSNFTIRQNEVVGINYTQATAASARAIFLYTNSGGGFGTSSNGIIDKNRIHFLRNSVTGSYAIVLQGTNTTDDFSTVISNNYVYDLTNTGNFATAFVLNTGTDCKIYHNTVNLYLVSGASNTPLSMCVYNASFSSIDCRNNIFRNNLASGSGDYIYYFYTQPSSSAFSYIDGNNYTVVTTTNGYLALDGSNMTNDASGFSSWKTAVSASGNGDDANSTINDTPTFNADADPHLSGASLSDANLLCTPVAVSGLWDGMDFDNELRRVAPGTGSSVVTFRGADEVHPNFTFTSNLTFNPISSTYCAGSAVTMSFGVGISGFQDGITRTVTTSPTYSWYKSTGSPTLISGQTNNSFVRSPIVQTDSANYNAYAKFAGDSVSTISKLLKVETNISITTQPPANSAVCSNSGILQMNVVAAGTINGYQWQKENPTGSGNYFNINGATTANLSITLSPASAATGNYRVQIFGPGNCGSGLITSSISNVTVADPLSAPSATINTLTPSYICTGSTVLMGATAVGTISAYQWQLYDGTNWNNLNLGLFPTSTSPTLQIPNITPANSGQYRCVITGNPSCLPTQVITTPISITIWALYAFITQPQTTNICKGDQLTLYVMGNGTTHSYQWQKDGNDISLADNPTAQTSQLVIANAAYSNSATYRCKMVIEDCRGIITVYSNEAVIYVERSTKITQQPITAIADTGMTATFVVDAEVIDDFRSNPRISLSLQWYQVDSKNNVITLVDNNRIAGSKSSILSISNLQASDFTSQYYVIVKGLCGQDQSISAKIVTPANIDITTQPLNNMEACVGGLVMTSVTAVPTNGGSVLTYQWYFNSNPVSDGGNYAGTTTNKLSIMFITPSNAGQYWVDITVDGQTMKRSTIMTLVVDSIPTITTQPLTPGALTIGKMLDLTLTATGSGSLTYQWYKDSAPIANQTSSELKIDSVVTTDGGSYTCVVTNMCGSDTSIAVNVSVSYFNLLKVSDPVNNVFELYDNVPNPFSETTLIQFNMLTQAEVKVSILDVLGKEVALLMNRTLDAGPQEIMLNTNTYNLTSGVYYCRVDAGNNSAVKKLMLIK